MCVCMCLCVCVCSREKETEGERGCHKTGEREAERAVGFHSVQLYTWTALSIYTWTALCIYTWTALCIYTVLYSPTPYYVYSYTLTLHSLYTLRYIHSLNTAILSHRNNIYILFYIHSHRILYSYTLTLIVCIHRTVYTHTASSTLPPHTATHPNSIAYTHPHHITDNNTALCHTALYLYCIISNVLMCECTWCSFAECIRILSKYTHLLSVRQDLYTDLLSVIRESLYMHACVDSARLSPMAMIVISIFFDVPGGK